MASKAKPLNDELKKQFYPWVKDKGFEKQKSTDPHFTEFRRQTPTGEDVFDIQWDKYWRPYFVVNFEKNGTNNLMWAHGGRLQRKRGGPMSCWFSLSKPVSKKILSLQWNYKSQEVVEELKTAFEELELWWEKGEIGSHMCILEFHA